MATFGPWSSGLGFRDSLKVHVEVHRSNDSFVISAGHQITKSNDECLFVVHSWTVPSDDSDMLQTNCSLSLPPSDEPQSVIGASSHRGKVLAPECEVSLRRSARSNKYDGFRVHALADTKKKVSKVKARHTLAAPSSVIIMELDNTDTPDIPPPTPIQVIQQVGVLQCAVPAEELTEAALLESTNAGPLSST